MNRLNSWGWILPVLILITACSSITEKPWTDAVPEKTPFIIIPAENATLHNVLESSYTPFLDDITSSAIQLLSRVDSTSSTDIPLHAIALYPGTNDQLETVWMAQAPKGLLNTLKKKFWERFSQNEYYFHDIVINKLTMRDRTLFAAQLKDLLLISESSLSIEDAIRAYLGNVPRADIQDMQINPGHILMNTPSIDRWIRQLTSVTYRPQIKNALKGTRPTLLSISQSGEKQQREIQLKGTLGLGEKTPTNLVAAFSNSNAPISLDRYISSNAAAFGLFRLPPRMVPPSIPDTTKLDSLFLNDELQYRNLAKNLNPEFSLVAFAQSGFLSTGEHVFIRKTEEPSAFLQEIESLAQNSSIQRRDNTFFVSSNVLGKLVGSELCTFKDFYLAVSGEAVIISKRKGLVEMVASDRNRRRTVYYEQSFRNIKEDLADEISGLFVAGNEFQSFIAPFLAPDNTVSAITSKFDFLATSASLNGDRDSLNFNISTYQAEERTAPYREKWFFPTGTELSGKPVLADIGGGEQNEIIFATKSGNLYVLAADGTVVMQANTGTNEPVGSPVIYDWYATNENIILLAAGDKVYGWNSNGQPLPKFPFRLSEKVSSGLVVNDIDQNGLPNAIVATSDRKLHVLDGRGGNIQGWPITTNSEITTPPTVDEYRGQKTIIAFSENAAHALSADGDQRFDFPKFLNASFNGSPTVYENNILGNGADGYLYAMGPKKLFADSLNMFEANANSPDIEALYASNSALIGTPSVQELTIAKEEQTFEEPMILTSSINGSIFLYNTEGKLRFTKSMGQPAAPNYSPFVTDINNDGQDDLIALADFGRLYVWEISSGERIFSVPTSAMKFPIISDIDNDGYKELIAQTREGLRCWTIFGE